jgi:hypothetical protein
MGKTKRNKSQLRSNCCNAKTKIGVGNFEGDKSAYTQYYICNECDKICDVHVVERKMWIRNPKTQIQPNKKEKNKKLFTEKELKNFRMNEDF